MEKSPLIKHITLNYVHTHIQMYTHANTHIHSYACSHIYPHPLTQAPTLTHTHDVHTCTQIGTLCTLTHSHIHVKPCIHTCAHTHTNTHVYTGSPCTLVCAWTHTHVHTGVHTHSHPGVENLPVYRAPSLISPKWRDYKIQSENTGKDFIYIFEFLKGNDSCLS